MAKSEEERKAMFANMNNGGKGTNSNDVSKNNPIPNNDESEKNRLLREDEENMQDIEENLEKHSQDTQTALDFIKEHPDSIADNLSESTDIGGLNNENSDLEIDRILTELEQEDKIIKFGDEEFPKYRIAEEVSSNVKELFDPSSETRFFEVFGLTAEPSIGDTIIKSDIIIRTTNMLEATGDERFIHEPIVGEILLVPENKSLSADILESIASSAGVDEDEVDIGDKIGYGAEIRLGQTIVGVDSIAVANELAKEAPARAGLIGFSLDQPVNQMGETGWDQLRKFTGVEE